MAASQGEVKVVIDHHHQSSSATTKHNQIQLSIEKQIQPSLNSILKRFHAGYFRISISLGGQALLWKTLIQPSTNLKQTTVHHLLGMLHSTKAFIVLWSLSVSILVLLSLAYILKCLFHFKMVKAEFLHHVGVNYLFAPWISCLLLLQSAPSGPPKTHPYILLWWAFAVPVVALDVKIYGQWFTKGKRFLSTVANPTSQLSVIGNLVGAQAAANMGWKECAVCLFSLGMVHYLVLFVTLYQRLSGGDRLPAMLRPVFFLFIAAPSTASLAWESITGAFDTASKMFFFLSLFLFASLVCRPNMFKRSMRRFNVAWWAYSFPLTVLALASTQYAREVNGVISHVLMIFLTCLSVLVLLSLAVFTVLNARMLLLDHDPIATILNHLPSTDHLVR